MTSPRRCCAPGICYRIKIGVQRIVRLPLLLTGVGNVHARPNIGTTMTTSRADEKALQVRQLDISGPAISVDHSGVHTFAVAANHPQKRVAGLPDLLERDLLFARHGPILPRITLRAEYAIRHTEEELNCLTSHNSNSIHSSPLSCTRVFA